MAAGQPADQAEAVGGCFRSGYALPKQTPTAHCNDAQALIVIVTGQQEKRPVFWRSQLLPRWRPLEIGKPVAETTNTLQGGGYLFWRGNDAHWICEGVQG